ncbi:MAG TPA: hypothetical protein VFR52_04930 [Sphingomicrobium sp.]|nr:hypothetical protein [Sphingomicrobium sp.]
MKQLMNLAAVAALGAIAAGSIVYAQTPAPPEHIVSLYRAAPGHQAALLQWFAQQDRIAQAAGVAPMQLYVHTNGDSWDYMGINPVTTPDQDAALDAAAKKLGLPTGPSVGLELRKHIAWHTDTYTVGPISAAQALARVGQQ